MSWRLALSSLVVVPADVSFALLAAYVSMSFDCVRITVEAFRLSGERGVKSFLRNLDCRLGELIFFNEGGFR